MLKQPHGDRAAVSYGGYPRASPRQVPREALPVAAANEDCPDAPHLGGKSLLAPLLKTKGLTRSCFGNTPGRGSGGIWQSPFTRASEQDCPRAKAVCEIRSR